ncbi:hypothetical protein T02_13160 [Trichinella nativa]|uniref:Uncharacterized protein n=2 Tax=Trichinella TaxID=6333 RepID=A0A0V1LTQ7_9BILA|nr:hypothetical protein T05_11555 [Trichinella murrelli]KRX82859.1 hypothetical protein T06_12446 [Trichinella sp. T6]KRZ62820.1 hypothetical protein T02_13160 [Trichinella nativa]
MAGKQDCINGSISCLARHQKKRFLISTRKLVWVIGIVSQSVSQSVRHSLKKCILSAACLPLKIPKWKEGIAVEALNVT